MEEAAINSLGLPQGNTAPEAFIKNPDGYVSTTLYDFFDAQTFDQSTFIEVKGKYNGTRNSETINQKNGCPSQKRQPFFMLKLQH